MNQAIEDFISYGVFDAFKAQGVPKMDRWIEDAITAGGYELVVKGMVDNLKMWFKFVDNDKYKDMLLKFIIQALILWGVRKGMKYDGANLQDVMIKQLVAQVMVEGYHMAKGPSLVLAP